MVDTAIGAVLAELERLEAIFSTYRADSVISAINRGERHPLDGPAEVDRRPRRVHVVGAGDRQGPSAPAVPSRPSCSIPPAS